MEDLSPEQIEEYKQIDARIIFLISQANRFMTGYFAAFIGFWIWMANRKDPIEIIPAAMVLSMILLLGVILLDIHGRSISKARAYKVVFIEKVSGRIHHESSRLKSIENWTIDRMRSYGLLGLLFNFWSIFLFIFDPTKSFVTTCNENLLAANMFFIPGIIYSCVIFFRENRFLKYTRKWEIFKKSLEEEVDGTTEQIT